MKRVGSALLVAWVVPWLAAASSYAEIARLNATCSPKDTCALPRDLDDSDRHNCDCSSLCVLYGTCCIDSPFLHLSRSYERPASCRASGHPGKHVFMVDKCSSNYNGSSEILGRCEKTVPNWSDPFDHIPATNPSSQKTYKSLFCAICNGENSEDLILWKAMVDCAALNEKMALCHENRAFVMDNIIYLKDKSVWGLWSWEEKSGDWKFRELPLEYRIPDDIKDLVRECRPNLVSSCDPKWSDKRTLHMCMEYTAAVYFPNAAYRNIHCAICNFEEKNMADMSCHDTSRSEFKGPGMSFGIMVDFSLKDGNKVGSVDMKCGETQVFDPFAKKCRDLKCPLQGTTPKNGKCVQE